MGEAAILLAPRYRRAVAALHVSALQGGLRGKLARDAYASLTIGLAMTFAGITIALGVRRGQSREHIMDELEAGLNPASSRFLLWRIGGQLIGPGSKYVSDIRLLAKIVTRPEDFANFDDFNGNPGLQWVRGQIAAVPSFGWTYISGRRFMGEPVARDFIGEPLAALKSLGRELGENVIPIWASSVIFEGGDPTGRTVRGATDFWGGRGFPEGAFDILKSRSFEILDRSFDASEGHERLLLREVLRDQLTPLQQKRAERGVGRSVYFAESDDIEQDRRFELTQLADKPDVSSFDVAVLNAKYRGRRLQAGVGQEFEDADINDPDPNKQALAEFYALFDNPKLRRPTLPSGESGAIISKEFIDATAALQGSWTAEQRAYVDRNTNTRPYPKAIFGQLSKASRRDIERSQRARETFFNNTGRPHLAKLSRDLFFLRANIDTFLETRREHAASE